MPERGRTATWKVEHFIGKQLEQAFSMDVLRRLQVALAEVLRTSSV